MIYSEKPDGFIADWQEVVGCFVEVNNDILLLLRSRQERIEPGKWACPAGKMERGENPAATMTRELEEETGLVISQKQLLPVRDIYVDYSSYGFKFVYHLFRLCFPFRPEITLSQEHVAYVWMPPSFAYSLKLMQDEEDCIKLVYGL